MLNFIAKSIEAENDITENIIDIAKQYGIVIMYGYANQVKADGAIREEFNSDYTSTILVDTSNIDLLTNDCSDNECPYWDKLTEKYDYQINIETIKKSITNDSVLHISDNNVLGHESQRFNLYEDDDLYCVGCCFCVYQ